VYRLISYNWFDKAVNKVTTTSVTFDAKIPQTKVTCIILATLVFLGEGPVLCFALLCMLIMSAPLPQQGGTLPFALGPS
jgi:hypothetical protein